MAYPDYGSTTVRGVRENHPRSVSLDSPKE